MLRNIVLDHSKNLGSLEAIELFDTSFRHNGEIISAEKALELKLRGATIEYPKKQIRYNYVVEPYKEMYTCRIGREINENRDKNINVCVVGDYNQQFPKREMLDILAILIRGLLNQYKSIQKTRVLPLRYFKKGSDGPGLLFNTKRFVKEYIINGNAP